MLVHVFCLLAMQHPFLKSVNVKRQRHALAELIEKAQRSHKRKGGSKGYPFAGAMERGQERERSRERDAHACTHTYSETFTGARKETQQRQQDARHLLFLLIFPHTHTHTLSLSLPLHLHAADDEDDEVLLSDPSRPVVADSPASFSDTSWDAVRDGPSPAHIASRPHTPPSLDAAGNVSMQGLAKPIRRPSRMVQVCVCM